MANQIYLIFHGPWSFRRHPDSATPARKAEKLKSSTRQDLSSGTRIKNCISAILSLNENNENSCKFAVHYVVKAVNTSFWREISVRSRTKANHLLALIFVLFSGEKLVETTGVTDNSCLIIVWSWTFVWTERKSKVRLNYYHIFVRVLFFFVVFAQSFEVELFAL